MPVIAVPGLGRVVFPDDMTPAEIQTAVARLVKEGDQRTQTARDVVGAPAPPALPSLSPLPAPPRVGVRALPSIGQTVADVATDALPMVGGLAGGLVGGAGGTAFGLGVGGAPGAMGGAALGGAAGEAGRQLINRARGRQVPPTPLSAATAIAGEGAVQGLSEGVGIGVGKAVTGLGRAMVENAVRPPITFQNEFPGIIDTILKERLPVGSGLFDRTPGSTLAKRKLQASARSVRRLLKQAEAGGNTYSPSQVSEPVLALIDDIAKQPLGETEERALAGMIDEFLRRHPGPLTPQAVKDLKQSAQALAKPIYRAEQAGNVVSADQALGRRFNESIARGSREALEEIPGVKQGEKQTQRLIGATKSLKRAEQRRMSLQAEALPAGLSIVGGVLSGQQGGLDEGIRNAAISYMVMRGMMSPRTLSRTGLTLTAQQTRELFRQFPRLAAEVVKVAGAGGTPRADRPSPPPREP